MTNLAFLHFQNMPNLDMKWIVAAIIVFTVVILLITFIPMLFSLGKIFGGWQQTQQLLATGEPAQARVLQLQDTGTTVNDNPQIEVLLEVRPANRPPYQVQTQCFVSRLRIPQV